MPLLEHAQVQAMLAIAAAAYGGGSTCQCGCPVVTDYCRTCDEFIQYHRAGCHWDDTKHLHHRSYLRPFVETRGFD